MTVCSFVQRQSILPIPPSLAGSLALGESAYLDFVNNTDGYTHIALFSPATSGTPIFISNDSWEVVDNILGIDANGIVSVSTFTMNKSIPD